MGGSRSGAQARAFRPGVGGEPATTGRVIRPGARGQTRRRTVCISTSPIDRSQTDEVDRVLSLGATRVDIGQGKTPWIVLADPEGNEFCVMPALDPFER